MGAGTISEMKNLECITLFVEDLAASKKFYLEIFDLNRVAFDAPGHSQPLPKKGTDFRLRPPMQQNPASTAKSAAWRR